MRRYDVNNFVGNSDSETNRSRKFDAALDLGRV